MVSSNMLRQDLIQLEKVLADWYWSFLRNVYTDVFSAQMEELTFKAR